MSATCISGKSGGRGSYNYVKEEAGEGTKLSLQSVKVVIGHCRSLLRLISNKVSEQLFLLLFCLITNVNMGNFKLVDLRCQLTVALTMHVHVRFWHSAEL